MVITYNRMWPTIFHTYIVGQQMMPLLFLLNYNYGKF